MKSARVSRIILIIAVIILIAFIFKKLRIKPQLACSSCVLLIGTRMTRIREDYQDKICLNLCLQALLIRVLFYRNTDDADKRDSLDKILANSCL